MNVLAIGNSFSQDATRYLHQVAKSAGVYLEVFNLEIGGCPLSKHFRRKKHRIKQHHRICTRTKSHLRSLNFK